MNFEEYQKASRKTAFYPNWGNNYIYPALGITSESGEVAGKVKKIVRDKGGLMSEQDKKEIGKELGDTLWYISQLATELGLSLNDLAEENINKLQSRQQRGTLPGDGDNR